MQYKKKTRGIMGQQLQVCQQLYYSHVGNADDDDEDDDVVGTAHTSATYIN